MRQLSEIVWHQSPLTLPPHATVQRAAREMASRRVGAVLVTDAKGRLLGIFTGRDAVNRILADGKPASRTRLEDVMTRNPTTMTPKATALDALRLMWDGGFRHVPVVADGKLMGVVSRGDFCAAERDRLEEERELWEHMR